MDSTNTNSHTHKHVHTYIHTHTDTHTQTHTHLYIYTHTNTHTHRHIYYILFWQEGIYNIFLYFIFFDKKSNKRNSSSTKLRDSLRLRKEVLPAIE